MVLSPLVILRTGYTAFRTSAIINTNTKSDDNSFTIHLGKCLPKSPRASTSKQYVVAAISLP